MKIKVTKYSETIEVKNINEKDAYLLEDAYITGNEIKIGKRSFYIKAFDHWHDDEGKKYEIELQETFCTVVKLPKRKRIIKWSHS